MENYSLETFEKLSSIIKSDKTGLTLEERALIAEMILDELSTIHCENYGTNCPYSECLGGNISEWEIECNYSGEVLKYNYRYSSDDQLDSCPYNPYFDAANDVIEEYHDKQLLKE